MPRDETRDVALTDDDEPGAGDEAAPTRGTPHRARRGAGTAASPGDDVGPAPGRRRRWPLVAGALALALTVGLVVDGIQTRARVAHLARVPGLLEPMDPALREVWRRPGGWQHPAVHGPDLMVSLFDGPDGSRLVATDIDTGEQRWDAALPDDAFGAVACQSLGADTTGVSTHIVCRVDVPTAPGIRLPASGPGHQVRLVVLDAHTGETVGDRPLDYGYGTVETLGSDVLVTTVLANGRVQLTREDPLTGRARWTVRSRQPLPRAGLVPGPHSPETEVQHGLIAVDGPMAMVLSPEGEVLGEWHAEDVGPAAGTVELTVLADGRFVVGTPGDAAVVPNGTVSASDARDGFSIDGRLLELAVDDGSAGDLVLTVPEGTGRIVALDTESGEPRWSAPATPRGGSVLLDHRLITTAGSDLVALDTRTGERLWTAESGPRLDHDLLTDGYVVLVPTMRAGEWILEAVDLTDGRVRWTAPGPPEVMAFFEIGGRLIALQQEHMIRLG